VSVAANDNHHDVNTVAHPQACVLQHVSGGFKGCASEV